MGGLGRWAHRPAPGALLFVLEAQRTPPQPLISAAWCVVQKEPTDRRESRSYGDSRRPANASGRGRGYGAGPRGGYGARDSRGAWELCISTISGTLGGSACTPALRLWGAASPEEHAQPAAL